MANWLRSEKSFPNHANGTLKFVNTVAERIEKEHPDCLITYYALYKLQGFPEVKPRDNVLPVMCHFLPIYLASKALRDTSVDSEQVLEEFYRDYYGAAAEPMREFWETFDDRTRWGAGRDGYQDCLYQYLPTLTADVVATCRGYLQRAPEMTGSAVVKRRIATVAQYWRIVELQIQAELALAGWKKNKTTQTWKAAKAALTETMDYINSSKGVVGTAPRMGIFRGQLRDLEKDKDTKIDSGFPGLEQ